MDLTPEQRKTTSPSESRYATVNEAVEAFLVYRRDRGAPPSTLKSYGAILRRFARDVGNMQMRNMRPHHVSDWFYARGGMTHDHQETRWGGNRKGIDRSTQNTYRAILKTFFEWSRKRGMIKHDLIEDVLPQKVPTRKRQQPKPEILLGFLDSARNPRDRAFLALSVNSGLRSSEMTRLRVGQVDLNEGYIRGVIRSKTGEEDDLPITADLDQELRTWLFYLFDTCGEEVSEESFLFPAMESKHLVRWDLDETGKRTIPVYNESRPVPNKEWTNRTHHVVQKALRDVGLPTHKEGTHTIRRAVARAYFDSMSTDVGYDAALRTVAALLGHQRLSTTERYLGLASERSRRDAMLKGKPFLSAMQPSEENVISLRDRMLGK